MPWEDKKILEQIVSTLSNFPNRGVDLGPAASLILVQFLAGPYFSPYKIHKILSKKKGYGSQFQYKDVHKRIQRLKELDLIRKVPYDQILDERTLHAPIFYRITQGGIYNSFFKNRDLIFREDKNDIFHYHGDNILFQYLIYPYFEQSTLIRIKGSFLPEIIFSYISKCCEVIHELIKILSKHNGSEVVPIPLFNWKEVPGDHDLETIMTIANEFGIDLSKKSKIRKYGNNRIEISDKNHSIIIQVNSKKNSATLTYDGTTTHNLAIEKSGEELMVNKVGTFRWDIALPSIIYRLRHNLLNLAFSIIMGVRMGGSEHDFIEARVAIDKEDLKSLLQDQKALQLLEQTHALFVDHYKSFVGIKKTDSKR